MSASSATLSALRSRISHLEGHVQAHAVLPFGLPELDRRLPEV